MSNKNIYLLNTEGILQEVYTVGLEFDKVYLKIKGVKKPVSISIMELSSLAEDIPQIIYSISSAAKMAFIDRTIDTADLIEELLEEKKSDEGEEDE